MGAQAHADHDEHKHHSWVFYAIIAFVLAVITLIEIGPLFEWYDLGAGPLILLSVLKFFLVVAFFMHLWDDPPIFSQMFVAPMIGGTLMVVVLMVLFNTMRPMPYEDSIAIQERYGDTFGGECSSWLRSHKSGRLYCASPMLDKDRVAMLGSLPTGEPIAMPDVGGGPEDDPETLAAYDDASDDDARKSMLISVGEGLYKQQCGACHGDDGKGNPGVYPPIANSDYLGSTEFHTGIVLNGLAGPIVVNGVRYNGNMQAFAPLLTNLQIAAIVTYERNAWGNDEGWISPDEVAALR
ncbi:MAG: hypothetical protein EA397_15280 [Deltaproteobacteria bacterium]|nr:MAG: hypothetical protein EA397_15280 [Deltaproteobacteria bacterium]